MLKIFCQSHNYSISFFSGRVSTPITTFRPRPVTTITYSVPTNPPASDVDVCYRKSNEGYSERYLVKLPSSENKFECLSDAMSFATTMCRMGNQCCQGSVKDQNINFLEMTTSEVSQLVNRVKSCRLELVSGYSVEDIAQFRMRPFARRLSSYNPGTYQSPKFNPYTYYNPYGSRRWSYAGSSGPQAHWG